MWRSKKSQTEKRFLALEPFRLLLNNWRKTRRMQRKGKLNFEFSEDTFEDDENNSIFSLPPKTSSIIGGTAGAVASINNVQQRFMAGDSQASQQFAIHNHLHLNPSLSSQISSLAGGNGAWADSFSGLTQSLGDFSLSDHHSKTSLTNYNSGIMAPQQAQTNNFDYDDEEEGVEEFSLSHKHSCRYIHIDIIRNRVFET